MDRYDVKRNTQGEVLVTLAFTVHNVGMLPGRTADEYNDKAIAWGALKERVGEKSTGFDRDVDANLLAAQYLYAEESEPWEDARPTCTQGTVGSGYCDEETLPGRLHCARHLH